MSVNPIQFRLPPNLGNKLEPEVAQTIIDHDDAINDLQQAIISLKSQITGTKSTSGTSTSVTEQVSTEQITQFINYVGNVNNQTGVTSYQTEQSDSGSLIVLDDSSAIAVTLAVLASAPGIQLPWWAAFLNLGAGTATLTPASGTISYAGNVGAGSLPITTGNFAFVWFDGTNFWGIASAPAAVNFVVNEQVSGGPTTWTLAHTPISGSVNLFSGSAAIWPGVSLDYTISGATITTNYSITAGTLWANYRH